MGNKTIKGRQQTADELESNIKMIYSSHKYTAFCLDLFVQFLSTVSSFLHIMTADNDFCKNELRFMSVTIFHLFPITIVDEIITKQHFFHL